MSLWARWGLAWLLSCVAHASVLLALALTFHVRQGSAARGGPTTGIGLDAMLVTSMSVEEATDSAGGDLVQPAQAISPIDELEDPARGRIEPFDDRQRYQLVSEPPPSDQKSPAPAARPPKPQPLIGPGSSGPATGTPDPKSGSNAAGLRPGYARTGVFGVVGEGRTFVYVFDRSGSMDGHGGAPLAAAKAQLIASLHDLGPTQQFQIIFYNQHPRVFNPTGVAGRLVFGTDQNKTLAERFIGGVTADGGTEHEEALERALGMSPDVVFFLTDADEPRLTPKQLARIERLNKGAVINAIEFGYGPRSQSDSFLVKLAQQNAGHHVYVDVSRLPQAR